MTLRISGKINFKTKFLSLMTYILQWNWQTIVIGATFLSFLLFTKYIVRTPNFCNTIYLVEGCELVSDSHIFLGAGKKEQEALLGACNCPTDLCYSVHLFCVYNPCRTERCCNC